MNVTSTAITRLTGARAWSSRPGRPPSSIAVPAAATLSSKASVPAAWAADQRQEARLAAAPAANSSGRTTAEAEVNVLEHGRYPRLRSGASIRVLDYSCSKMDIY